MTSFRPGEDLAPGEVPVQEPLALAFTSAADAGGTDFDVLMGYQMFLGRDPETSFVIADAKSSPVGAFIRALMGSGEFQSAVLDKLLAGRALPHENASPAPLPEQLDWLFRHVRLPAQTQVALRVAPGWREWLRILVAVPGFPQPPGRDGVAAGATGVAVRAADDGFVLVHLEQPKPGERLLPGTLVTGSGWAIAPADVAEVSVHLDRTLLTHARYGLPRPDVARSFPHYRHVDHCGFAFTAEIPAGAVLASDSQLIVSVRTVRGELGRKSVRVGPPADLQDGLGGAAPGGAGPGGAGPGGAGPGGAGQGWPIRLSVDEAVVDADRTLRVRGWAASLQPMRAVTASLGDTALGRATYGLSRPEIARAHPGYGNAGQSGFSLVQHVPAELPAGPAFVRVEAEDERGQTRQTIVPVVLPAVQGDAEGLGGQQGPGAAVNCSCDSAALSESGLLALAGWAFGQESEAAVEVELDGAPVGHAETGRKRPDVARRYPGVPLAARSGFAFHHQLKAAPGTGPHALVLRIACDGQQRVIERSLVAAGTGDRSMVAAGTGDRSMVAAGTGDRSMVAAATGDRSMVAAATGDTPVRAASTLRLEIDRPVLDGDTAAEPVRGALTISGWAVARHGLAQVLVYCDDALLGHAHLGMRREDIGSAFPDYEGSLLAGYALVLPPGSVPEGRHEIRVVAQGRAGPNAERGLVIPDAERGFGIPEAERRFTINVEHFDSVAQGGAIRTRLAPAEAAFGLRLLERLGHRPGFEIGVAMPGGLADLDALTETLSTLIEQVYPEWTAIISLPDQSSCRDRGLLALLERAAGKASLAWPGKSAVPSRQRRAATPLAEPRFVMRLLAGDRLGADALLALATEAAADRRADFIYADDARIDRPHGRRQPFFKPDWSPELLLSMNYVGRAWCASRELAERAGLAPGLGDRAGSAPGVSDYDCALRLTEGAAAIRHVAQVLFDETERHSDAEERAALTACLVRRKIAGAVEPGSAPGTWRVRRSLVDAGRKRRSAAPVRRVSIIIPTCAAGGLIRTAIKTLRATSAPARPDGCAVEIVVLDNTPPRESRTRSWLRRNADVVVAMPGPFNWSRFNNEGARAATGDYLLFLNDDIETAQPDWLEAMIEQAQRPDVGVVGARLLYPDGKVQHGGQYLADTHARHAFRFAGGDMPGPFGLAQVSREVISVTGACQMVRAGVFKALGGFEEAHSVINNDLDFCLRSWRAGLSVVFTPHATLTHHELASRASLEDSYDEARFAGTWRDRFLRGDPFRNPHLNQEGDHYGAEAEPAVLLHVGRRGPAVAEIRRILAVKLDHIGDFLTALPALRSLARRFPNATINLLAPAASAELAAREPVIAETIVFDFFHARSGEGRRGLGGTEFEALQARLAGGAYDLAIDLRMQPETREVLPYTGARFLAGYDHGNRFPFLDVALEWEGDDRLVGKRAHVSERLVQLVSAVVDACGDPVGGDLPARMQPRSVPALAALPPAFLARPLVCIHPGVGNFVRQWPPAHFAALIDLLALDGYHSVLIGGPDEAAVSEEVLRRVSVPGCAETVVGRVKLAQLSEVMLGCVLFVGNNSGPQHLAASLGLPAIGIHSGVVDAVEWAPLGVQAMAIQRRMICSPCYLEFASDCPRDLACLTGLRPAEVFDACRRLLGSASQAVGVAEPGSVGVKGSSRSKGGKPGIAGEPKRAGRSKMTVN